VTHTQKLRQAQRRPCKKMTYRTRLTL